MPRESYYQNAGNPLRRELLPSRRLSTALPAREPPLADQFGAILGIAVAVVVADAIDYCLTSRPPMLFLSIGRAIALVGLSAFVLLHFVNKSRLRGYWDFLVPISIGSTLAAAGELLLHDFAVMRWLHAGLIGFCYVSLFGEHWTRRCVTSPVSRATATKLLAQWNRSMTGLALIPLAIAILGITLGPILAACFAVALALVATVEALPSRPWRRVRAAFGSLGSWLTCDPPAGHAPGVFESPAGNARMRWSVTFCAACAMTLCLRGTLPLPILLPSLLAMLLPLILLSRVLAEASPYRRERVTPANWNAHVNNIRTSPNPIERRSYYMGRVLADGSPLLVPREVFGEHAHFLGDSGSGKTSMGLLPFMEQTILFGDISLVGIDLKSHTLEMLATMINAKKHLKRERGIDLPLKYLTTRDDLSTFAFTPQSQPVWRRLNAYKRTDLLAGATGLHYGDDYGHAFFSSANAGVIHHTNTVYPDIKTFDELAERCGHVLATADQHELHREIRKNGVHVHEVLKRLAAFPPLNVAAGRGFPDEVIEQAIDLADVFRRPQLLFFHLSSTLGPGSAPAIARFVCYFLLASAASAERNVPVFLVIDEFQRMVARNFEYMLQLARSMGVGIILANQSMEDLKTSTADLIPTIEANCRYRQWFSVSSSADRDRLARSSGETVDYLVTRGSSTHSNGGTSSSVSLSERIVPRLSANDIMLASDHPKHSIVRISRGAGYAQYGGLPFLCESDYHITEDEYERRRGMRWPNREPGTFIPDEHAHPTTPPPPPGPVVTTEVIGGKPADEDAPLDDLVRKLQDKTPPRKNKRRRGR